VAASSSLVDDAWRARVERWEALHAERLVPGEIPCTTLSGIPVDAIYNGGAREDHDDKIGLAGEYPFTRGINPGMYREQLWVMGQYSGRANAKETNRRIRNLLTQGQRGFSIALDLPTQVGLDSDSPLARGEVGRVGVAIDSLRDMEILLKDIPLDQVRQIRTTANAIGPIAVALFVAAAERFGFSPKQFKVMLQNDVMKEYVARGTQIFPPRAGLRFSVDVIEYCARQLPHWEPIEFCGYHIRDAGSNAIQELAIAVANGIEYIESTCKRGLAIDDFAHSLFMFLCAHIDIFEEVAKFRAARRIWARIMKDKFGATHPESWRLNIFSYTLGSPLTAQEPLNNVVRVAYEALAAILGGAQTLATSSYDEAIQLPSDDAARISLRTQQILAYETGVARTADPLGGSYFVEALTDQLEKRVLDMLGEIERQGGALAALESGWIGRQIDDEAYRQQMEIENGSRVIVGVNRFRQEEGSGPTAFRGGLTADSAVENEQIASLVELRSTRDSARVNRCLSDVRSAAAGGTNTVPPILEAVRAYATVGEICDVLRQVWGEYRSHLQQ
jgi:methylmalonyl-CoA mutase N-terminal domain/subunit